MGKRFLFTIGMLVFVGVVAILAVIMAKGYSFSPKQGALIGTGIISATSIPDGASVYIDGHLATATNATLNNLSPKVYSIKIIKDGFIPWEKSVEVKEGVVSSIKATLFPSLPTIYPLTYNGALNPILSPDGTRLAFSVPISPDARVRQTGGIWVWTMTNQPIALARSGEPHQIVISTSAVDFSKATFRFSPDAAQLLVKIVNGSSESNYLLPVDRLTSAADLRDITPTLSGTLKLWTDDQKAKDDARILAIKNLQIRQIASDSSQLAGSQFTAKNNELTNELTNNQLKWSPDETKFISIDKKGAKVYDLVMDKSYDLPVSKAYFWLPDSLHVILVMDGKVSISEFDGANVAVIYAGTFEDSSVFPWPDYSRLVILTSFNTPTASTPNLFGINLK